MKITALLSAGALALAALLGTGTVSASAVAVPAACHYHHSGNHWICITPGAFCPKAAHGHYGLSKYDGSRYWCRNRSSHLRWVR
jgi:hypothetical protein